MSPMRVTRVSIIALVVSVSLLGCGTGLEDGADPGAEASARDVTIDALASGGHYGLNLIGVPKGKKVSMTGNEGHRIFVPLEGRTSIYLTEGEDYGVLDANATDGRGELEMPNPDSDGDGITEYSVWTRALGKPGGSSTTTLCGTDAYGETYCSAYSTVSVRTNGKNGKSSWTNATRDLFTMSVDMDGDGVLETYNVFDDELEDYFWQYDNRGLKILQMRFYPVGGRP